jgi:thiaminase (transcriptional activator TenA)
MIQTLGARLAVNAAEEPRSRRWVGTYADPGFVNLPHRIADMIDEAAPDRTMAEKLFLEGMRHEVAFWDVPL